MLRRRARRSSAASSSRPSFARTRAYTRAESPAVTVTAPGKSKLRRAGSARLSEMSHGVRRIAPIPIGTFTNSTERQPSALVRTPPDSTPAAAPAPATAPQTASALLLSLPSRKVAVTSESAAGARSAAASPWIARAPISHAELSASPPASEASENTPRPMTNTRRRPSRSAIRPPSSRKPPKVSTYALTTHERPASER